MHLREEYKKPRENYTGRGKAAFCRIIMININLQDLNDLECSIHETIMEAAKSQDNLLITESAELCGCSTSKISKFVRKLGFDNYKQYMQYVNGEEIFENSSLSRDEFSRIKAFMDSFDFDIVGNFVDLIQKYDKVILLGYGPTYYAMTYFEYKLRFATEKNVFAVQENQMAKNLMSEDTLVLCFSVTGVFKDFSDVYNAAKSKGAYPIVIMEEYNVNAVEKYDNIIFLTEGSQPDSFEVYEKSRILFFIFIEEICRELVKKQREKEIESQFDE